MQPFAPQRILVEREVSALPLTQRILQRFPEVPREEIQSLQGYKEPGPMTPAKKVLALAAHRGEAVKHFPKIRHALNLGDYVFNPVSNCHLECTYCILQSYLKNNPVLTVFANTDHFFSSIRALSEAHPGRALRMGTGELSDSLALDGLTGLSETWIPFFAELPNAYLELKTKSDCVENLLQLPHRGRTVISWSLAPAEIVQREELKCASLSARLSAASRVQDAGYPVGLHLDPLIHYPEWREGYRELLQAIAEFLDPSRLAWVSMGSLRFDGALKAIAGGRFPSTPIFAEDIITAPDGKMRYFKTIRLEMYRYVWGLLREWSEDFPRYLCMEAPWMWEAVLDGPAPPAEEVENNLIRRLEKLG